jgi:hypothetical protein
MALDSIDYLTLNELKSTIFQEFKLCQQIHHFSSKDKPNLVFSKAFPRENGLNRCSDCKSHLLQ